MSSSNNEIQTIDSTTPNGTIATNIIPTPSKGAGRPRSYSSRSKENLLSTDNPYSKENISLGLSTAPNSTSAGPITSNFSNQPASITATNKSEGDAIDHHMEQKLSSSTDSDSGLKYTLGYDPGLPLISNVPPPVSRARSRTVGANPNELVKSRSLTTRSIASKASSMDLHSSSNLLDTFAFFCRIDSEPRVQRKLLFALNQRHTQFHRGNANSNSIYCDTTLAHGRNGSKKTTLGSKLNALLRSKKQKRTRTGIFHSLNLCIHDYRVQEGLLMVELLSDNTIRKKRVVDSNKTLLHALANRMQTLAIQIIEKGHPRLSTRPIYAPSSRNSFTFPSYFQLAVSLDLLDVVKIMLKEKIDVDISWYQMTPIMIACMKGNQNMVKLLINFGANPNQRIMLEDFLLLKRLKPTRRSVNALSRFPDMSGWGISAPCPEKILEDDSRDSSCFSQFGAGPYHFDLEFKRKYIYLYELAMACGHYDIAAFILEITSPPAINASCFGLLFSNDFEFTKQMLISGVDPKIHLDGLGSTFLHIAARRGNLDMVIVILQSGFDINTPGAKKWTALHEALSTYQLQVFHYLLFKLGDINAETSDGENVRALAERRGLDSAAMKLFFEEQGDIEFFESRENVISQTPGLKSSLNHHSPLQKTSKDREKAKFGGLFSKNFVSSSSTSLTATREKKRGFFGRASVSTPPVFK